jgi:hypothetical protein
MRPNEIDSTTIDIFRKQKKPRGVSRAVFIPLFCY